MSLDYPWQETQWQWLQSIYCQERLPQALLFQGISGLGKVDCAKKFAAYVLCDNTPQHLEACGQCRSCQLFQAGTHPDFYLIQPEEKSKSIKVDQLRYLIDRLVKTAQRAAYQIAIIQPAETMNRAAANALLKTLEEPCGDVLNILVSHRMHALPATLISRCQRIDFSPSNDKKTLDWVGARLDADIDPALLLKMADAAPLRALQLVETNYFELRDQLLRHFIGMQKRSVDPIAPVAAFLKQDLGLLVYAVMTLVMDMTRLRLGVTTEQLFHTDRLPQLQSLSQQCDAPALQRYFSSCQRAQAALQSAIHLNPQLLLENLFIEYYRMVEV